MKQPVVALEKNGKGNHLKSIGPGGKEKRIDYSYYRRSSFSLSIMAGA